MRLIDVDALIRYANNSTIGIDANDIARFPRVDAVPVVHGRWIKVNKYYGTFIKCTACNTISTDQVSIWWKYCPCCGARMDEKDGVD